MKIIQFYFTISFNLVLIKGQFYPRNVRDLSTPMLFLNALDLKKRRRNTELWKYIMHILVCLLLIWQI